MGIVKNIIFSKDRPMQLDATIVSMKKKASDFNVHKTTVLYCVSNEEYAKGYELLIKENPDVKFVYEDSFKENLLQEIMDTEYVAFFVDDNIFLKDFSFSVCVDALKINKQAIGVSLRLGKNTDYCYALNQKQKVPDMDELNDSLFIYRWVGEEHDFSYPLELSSSIYRTEQILPLFEKANYRNPNELEHQMACASSIYSKLLPKIICFDISRTFCAPINIVQDIYDNRAGNRRYYSVESLLKLYLNGKRIDTDKYIDFIPVACHQEVDLEFKKI